MGVGAVVGTQPFGGTGLSGTGPKAGGPDYLLRFTSEQVVTINTAAAGGNATLNAGRDLTQNAGSLLAGNGRATLTAGGAATRSTVSRGTGQRARSGRWLRPETRTLALGSAKDAALRAIAAFDHTGGNRRSCWWRANHLPNISSL